MSNMLARTGHPRRDGFIPRVVSDDFAVQRDPSTHEYERFTEGQHAHKPEGAQPTPNGKWGFTYSIHTGTLMSRDSDGRVVYEYDSFAGCQDALTAAIAAEAQLRHFIWHATAIAPDGTRHRLCEGAGYAS